MVTGAASVHGATSRRRFAPGLRSFSAGDYVIIHRIVEDGVVLILHVVHGSRDIVALFGR
jgi:plasmid stabilization system protein ParE